LKQYLEFVYSFIVIVLVLSGLGGISFNLFRDDGWIESLFGKIWAVHIQYPLIAIPVTIGAVVLGAMWRDNRIAKGQRSNLPTYVLYMLMAAGAYYLYQYAVYGTV
jgi:hypothetical protein